MSARRDVSVTEPWGVGSEIDRDTRGAIDELREKEKKDNINTFLTIRASFKS